MGRRYVNQFYRTDGRLTISPEKDKARRKTMVERTEGKHGN
jgi:hypothetical protein